MGSQATGDVEPPSGERQLCREDYGGAALTVGRDVPNRDASTSRGDRPGAPQADGRLHEVVFELRREGPYRDLSERFAALAVREWHRGPSRLVEVTSETPRVSALLEALRELGTVLYESNEASGVYAVVQPDAGPADDPVLERFRDHRCVAIPPTVHRDGRARYLAFGFEERDVHGLLRDLQDIGDLDIHCKKTVENRTLPQWTSLGVDSLFASLTDRQLEALQIALENGYYHQPRGASIRELAAETAVAPATFDEHLRKAENKLLSNMDHFIRWLGGPRSSGTLAAPSYRATSDAESD